MKNPAIRRGQSAVRGGLDNHSDSNSDAARATHCKLLDRPAPSPHERARICGAIARELALEDLNRVNFWREVRARVAIGLKAFPRMSEQC